MAAIGDGRFAEAEAAAEELERRGNHMERSGGYGLNMFVLRREQGRLDEVRAPLELLARLGQADGAWGPGLAAAYAEIGMVAEAAALLERLLVDRLEGIARNSMWPGVLSFLADACCATGHRAGAEAVYRELLPYQGLMICMTGLAYFGAADRHLGRLADVLGRPREALAHLEAALRLDQAAGWPVWTAHSRHALGRLLVQRSRSDDRARGRAMLEAARDTADSLGMASLAARCAEALAPADQAGPPVSLTERELTVLRLVAEGRTNQDIGQLLHTSRHTVANQVRAILMKTGCGNRTEAAAWAHHHGLTAG
jgi:DNA-binding CsgD family transcriptional regulator